VGPAAGRAAHARLLSAATPEEPSGGAGTQKLGHRRAGGASTAALRGAAGDGGRPGAGAAAERPVCRRGTARIAHRELGARTKPRAPAPRPRTPLHGAGLLGGASDAAAELAATTAYAARGPAAYSSRTGVYVVSTARGAVSRTSGPRKRPWPRSPSARRGCSASSGGPSCAPTP
jgi:hypothetical protein